MDDRIVDLMIRIEDAIEQRDAAVRRAEAAEQALADVREWVKEDGESALVFKVSIRRIIDAARGQS